MIVRRPLDTKVELLEAFDYSFRVSEYLVGALPKRLWRANPPGGNGRSIAAIVAHMQSVRRTFAKMGGAPVALWHWTATARQQPRHVGRCGRAVKP
jgi:hypothetical protein